jgi:nucleoside 2-deoxyribosyltransferase
MRIYLAGPLFSPAERAFLADCARVFRAAGIDCFVPHEHEFALGTLNAASVFAVDCGEGIAKANALVAWLDGPMVDDGTACEIGIFYGLMQQRVPWRKGIIGLSTDMRRQRMRSAEAHGGINLFVAGCIEAVGRVCWSVDDAREQLLVWKQELGEHG